MSKRCFGRAVAVAALVGLSVAGCGGGAQPVTPAATASNAPTAAGAAKAQHNDADVQFAQGMIVHHRQAIQMADLAADRSQNPQVQDLAKRISAAQGPEIETLSNLLREWGQEVPAESDTGGMPGMNHGDMPGAMTPEQMQQLDQASGADFDRMFLQMMTEHHRGAVQMAQAELNNGANPDAKQLAQNVVTTQQAEITEMEKLLQQI